MGLSVGCTTNCSDDWGIAVSNLTQWIDRTFYPGIEDHWDNVMFREQIMQSADRMDVDVLDLGAGRGGLAEMDFKDEFSFPGFTQISLI